LDVDCIYLLPFAGLCSAQNKNKNIFQANRAAESDAFFDQLAAKYAKPTKGGKKKK
jgi:hypothetical protein